MESGKLVGKGVAFQLLQFMMDKYNFTYKIVKHDRNVIGSQDDFSGSLLQSLYNNVRKLNNIDNAIHFKVDRKNFNINM